MMNMMLAALAVMLGLASANIVELNGFRLSPFVLVKKHDFTYSSGTQNEDFSAVKFDLRIRPVNTEAQQQYALMMITADQDASVELVSRLTNGTQQASPADTGVKRKEIEWIDDVDHMLDSVKKDFAVYEVHVFEGAPNSTSIYNHTFSIPTEGVFSTYFLFGQHKTVEGEEEDLLEELIDDMFGEDKPPGSGLRALTASHAFDTKQPHLLITGQISFVNSFGFLNADQYPLMQFYLIMFFVYLLSMGFWINMMRKNGENKVGIHNYFCLLFLVTCIECAITFLEYDIYNESGKRVLPLTCFCVFFTAFRETLANLICLLIALGYGIVMNVLNRYAGKVFLLSFLFFISCAINVASFYINQHKPLS